MYGGLQAAIGALALAALLRPDLVKTALLTLAFLTGGLALARVLAAVTTADGSAYTIGAIGFETVSLVAASWLYRTANAPEITA